MNFNHYLERIAGVTVYPIISLLVFVLFFVVLAIRVVRMKKDDILELENMPLTDSKSNEKLKY